MCEICISRELLTALQCTNIWDEATKIGMHSAIIRV